MRPLRVFLCHASQDKPTVWKLHRYLKQHGIKPWLDQEDLLPGEDWEVEIPRALFASDVILVCLSKNSVNKEGFVQKEITFALDKALEKPEGTIFIIPVKLEECEIPKRLTRYHWVDLSRADGRKRLLMGLNKRVNDLGDEVQQIILDDTRHTALRSVQGRTPIPKTPKPEIKKPEEQIVSAPVKEEIKEEPKKEIPAKPFTKLLTPSSLSPNGTSFPHGGEAVAKHVRKSAPKNNSRWLGIGIILFALICGALGLNYLIQNLPVTTTPKITATPERPTLTSIPFTPTPQPTKTLIPTPTLGIGSTMISEKDSMVLLYVPAGKFTMGDKAEDALTECKKYRSDCQLDWFKDEEPPHDVDLDVYWIDQTEVTNSMYAKCVSDGACKEPTNTSSSTHSSYYGNSEFDNYPVIYVDWNMANAYCSWTDRRLPTEAEWEKAARGEDGNVYPWGNDFDCHKGNFDDETQADSYVVPGGPNCDGYADVAPVGNYMSGKSIYGALDMAGNVWEWVNDWYSDTYYKSSPSSNPLGPDSGQYRVLRGGSWYSIVNLVRSAYRFWLVPSDSYLDFGFRCSRSP